MGFLNVLITWGYEWQGHRGGHVVQERLPAVSGGFRAEKKQKKRKNSIITTKFPHRWPVIWLLVSQLPRQDVQLGKQHDGREQDIHSLAAKEN